MLVASLFYMLAVTAFFGAFLLVRKDDTSSHSAAGWIVIHAGVLMWVNTFIAGIYALVGIPVTLVSLAIACILLTVPCVWSIRKKGIQKLNWNAWDFAMIFCIAALAVGIGAYYHTPRLQIRDFTGDSCMHYRYAATASKTGVVKGQMFFAPVNIGVFMSITKPFLRAYQYYKAFVAMGIMMLALSGCAFYAIISDRLQSRVAKVLGLVFSALYMLGYPLHNELMGFNYLGMAVTIVMLMVYFIGLYTNGTMENDWALLILMLGCFSLVMCYMLFAPVIYIALFICLALHSYRREKTSAFVVKALKVFLVPCALGIYFCYFSFFGSRGLSIQNAINTGGGTRGRFYSYLLILLPTTLYFVLTSLKKKEHIEINVFLACVVAFAAAFIGLVFLNKISVYYYSKVPYLVWFVMSIASYYGLGYMLAQDRRSFITCVSMFGCLFLIWALNINGALLQKASQLGYAHYSENYRTVSCGIYDENLYLLPGQPYDLRRIDLFRYIEENCEDETVPLLGDLINYIDVYWCENFTGQDLSAYYYWNMPIEEIINRVTVEKQVRHVAVMYNTSLYNDHIDLWNQFEKVFDNSAGCILEID